MTIPLQGESATKPQLVRGIGLGSATALNMIDMIGVGPFITIPLIVTAMGGPQAMLGWVLGALLAICDGLVWAELGAAMPGSGGSYRYLKEIYGPQKLGRLISFLFIWQLSFSAPLSIASGAIGLSQYAAFFWPGLERVWSTRTGSLNLPLIGTLQLTWVAMPATLVAIGVCALTAFLLYRRITAISRLTNLLWLGVMGTIGWIIFAGLTHFNAHRAFDLPPGAFSLSRNFFHGLGGAMLIAAYDIGGYYNVCFLGDEVKEPAKNIPRALFLSILAVVCLYIVMNVSILGVIPWRETGAVGRGEQQAVRGLDADGESLRTWSGVGHLGPGHVDSVRFGVFADARVFARAVRGGARRKLFSGLCAGASRASSFLMFRCWRWREWRRCSVFCGWRI
jgi:basic amino acid/polyamine antiporter, APA family